jgi:hypothetical protein
MPAARQSPGPIQKLVGRQPPCTQATPPQAIRKAIVFSLDNPRHGFIFFRNNDTAEVWFVMTICVNRQSTDLGGMGDFDGNHHRTNSETCHGVTLPGPEVCQTLRVGSPPKTFLD